MAGKIEKVVVPMVTKEEYHKQCAATIPKEDTGKRTMFGGRPKVDKKEE